MKEVRKIKTLKQLCNKIINYRTAKTNLKEHYPDYSGTTQIEWNTSKQQWSIEVGSDLAKKVLGRSRVRLIPFEDVVNYHKVHANMISWEQITTHCFTFSPIQPTKTNKVDIALTHAQLRFHIRSVFDYLVDHNQGTNVFMIVRLEANENKAQLGVAGFHIHAVAIATDMDVTWRTQSRDIEQLTKENFGEHYGDRSHYMVEYDYSYTLLGKDNYYDYCHKPTYFVEQEPSINYILMK